ncbi:MAG: glycosyltransferase [Ignavibacteria bacterium]|nr:glycosyltransferase [Ignavibacteria bacterium]
MKNNILFISDSSLKNPILQSQGLPYLSQLDSKSFNVFFIYFEDFNDKEIDKNLIEEIKKIFSPLINYIEVKIDKEGVYPKWFNFIWRSTKVCKRIVQQNNIHLIHARSFFPALSGVIIKTFFNPSIKVIYDNRGLYIDEHIYNSRIKENSIKEIVFRWLEKVILKKCDFIVVVSKKFRSYLLYLRIIPDQLIKNKIEVIPNRTKIIYTEAEILKNKLTKKELIECVYSGSLANWQGTHFFYDLLESLIKVIPEIRFKILSYENNLLQNSAWQKRGLENVVKRMSLSQENVVSELVKSNFGILLRPKHILSKVCSPIKFAEYLAAGLPLILNEDIGDTGETILKHRVGVIIKNSDFDKAASDMRALLLDEDIYSRCIGVAKSEFDIETSFEQYENIYNKLLD